MKRTPIATATLALAVLVVCFIGQSGLGAQDLTVTDRPSASVTVSTYRLTPGDVLEIRFPYHQEFDATVTVRPDGYISLVMIGEVRADGQTPLELAALLHARYEKVVRRPETAVIVKDFAPQRVYVGGEVMAPGPVDLRGQLTSLQAVLRTGGAKISAKLDSVLLMRYVDGNKAEVWKLNLKRVLEGREEDAVLRPYDVLYVPTSKIGKVGLFVEQYVNNVIPRSLTFPYNLNTVVTVK